jgi:hypothetical protein
MRTGKQKIVIIHSLEEIPDSFSSEDEEREWWATHELSDALYEQLPDYTEEHRQWQNITQRKSDSQT